jgi:carotenoid cleavage dioxygenase
MESGLGNKLRTKGLGLRAVNALDSLLDLFGSDQKWNTQNKILAGAFAPVSEEHNAVPLHILFGKIPDDIDGLFMRNGPNPVPAHNFQRRNHWFDGHGMYHCVRFTKDPVGGQTVALYSNAYIQTHRYQIEQHLGYEYFIRLGELTGLTGLIKVLLMKSWKYKIAGVSDLTNSPANTHTVLHNNRLLALNEGGLPFEIGLCPDGTFTSKSCVTHFDSDQTKATQRGDDQRSSAPIMNTSTKLRAPISAHPKVDARTGEMMFHGYQPGQGGVFQYGCLTPKGQLTSYIRVQTSGDSFSHDMLITEHYSILFDFSVRFDPQGGISNGNFFKFNRKHRARIGVLPRHAQSATEVCWYELPGAFSLIHPLNAWEEKDECEQAAVGGARGSSRKKNKIVIWSPIGTDFVLSADLSHDCNKFDMCCITIDHHHVEELDRGGKGEPRQRHAYAHVEHAHATVKGGKEEIFVIPASAGRITMQVINTHGHVHSTEFPTLHPAFIGHKSRFGFSGVMEGTDANFVGMAKWDLQSRKLVGVIRLGERETGGEPVIIPKLAGAGAGAGAGTVTSEVSSDAVYLAQFITTVHGTPSIESSHGSNGRNIDDDITTEFVLYDGETWSPTPVLRLKMPYRVPIGFHGLWIPHVDMEAHMKANMEMEVADQPPIGTAPSRL